MFHYIIYHSSGGQSRAVSAAASTPTTPTSRLGTKVPLILRLLSVISGPLQIFRQKWRRH